MLNPNILTDILDGIDFCKKKVLTVKRICRSFDGIREIKSKFYRKVLSKSEFMSRSPSSGKEDDTLTEKDNIL